MRGVAPYPAAAALRRRAARQEGEAFAPPRAPPPLPRRRRRVGGRDVVFLPPQEEEPQANKVTFSHVYCLVSTFAALLAVVLAPASSTSGMSSNTPSLFFEKGIAQDNTSVLLDLNTVENVAKAAAMGLGASKNTENHGNPPQDPAQAPSDQVPQETPSNSPPRDFDSLFAWFFKDLVFVPSPAPPPAETLPIVEKEQHHVGKESATTKKHNHNVPFLFRWMFPNGHHHESSGVEDASTHSFQTHQNPFLLFLLKFVDPSLLRPNPSTMTDMIDKVLTSTPRLLSIANFLLAMTYLVHSAVVEMFLGNTETNLELNLFVEESARGGAWAGRERLGGFLVFKLLLISAVVVPDTLDLLILLSWYTLLSFLRSLAHLAAATTAHTSQSGQAPRRGVLRLLLAVLVCDVCAAAVCVALFHGAGWGMVLLLTLDCALLGVDVLCHVLRHVSQAMEEGHATETRRLEQVQIQLSQLQRHESRNVHHDELQQEEQDDYEDENEEPATTLGGLLLENDQEHRQEESRRLDRRMELMEESHTRRLAALDTTVFVLQLVAYALTVGHFLHIWSLHGLHFTLIDGVLALHLHSAVSAAGKKVAERRNLHRIARALDGMFEDATELEMRKASATGDVCCICLGTMSAGQVKKVGCGHLYHTNCLRSFVERARSIEAAKCPLCRACVVDGRQPSTNSTNTNNNAMEEPQQHAQEGNVNPDQRPRGGDNNNNAAGQPQQQQAGGEHALFRFSTENILPAWLPVPAFSFEVVRRPTGVAAPPDNNNAAADNTNNGGAVPQQQPRAPQEAQPQEAQPQSFWRRLLILSGAIPMSPQEEAQALDQLVDMFPQYDRADLQGELRDRGSSEAVVEAVLQGVFSGVPRGDVVDNNAIQDMDEMEPHPGDGFEEEEEELIVQEEEDMTR